MSVLTVTLLAQSLLGDRSHRLLSAAQAAKMAVVYSRYTSLYVLTNAVRWTEESSHPNFCRMGLFGVVTVSLLYPLFHVYSHAAHTCIPFSLNYPEM